MSPIQYPGTLQPILFNNLLQESFTFSICILCIRYTPEVVNMQCIQYMYSNKHLEKQLLNTEQAEKLSKTIL